MPRACPIGSVINLVSVRQKSADLCGAIWSYTRRAFIERQGSIAWAPETILKDVRKSFESRQKPHPLNEAFRPQERASAFEKPVPMSSRIVS